MLDLDKCPCSGRTLARLIQPAVMAVLAREALHGYVIAQRLHAMDLFREQKPDVTGLYRLLKNMEKRGLVTSVWERGPSGPAKRRYRLAPDGHACLERWVTTLRSYQRTVGALLAVVAKHRPARAATSRGVRT